MQTKRIKTQSTVDLEPSSSHDGHARNGRQALQVCMIWPDYCIALVLCTVGIVRRSSSGSSRFLSRRKGRSASPNLRKKKNVYVNLSSSELYPNYLEKAWTDLYSSIGWRCKEHAANQFVVPQGISFNSIFNHSESKAIDETTPLCVDAHPFLPLYFTGGAEGTAYLWNSEHQNAVVEFKASEK